MICLKGGKVGTKREGERDMWSCLFVFSFESGTEVLYQLRMLPCSSV